MVPTTEQLAHSMADIVEADSGIKLIPREAWRLASLDYDPNTKIATARWVFGPHGTHQPPSVERSVKMLPKMAAACGVTYNLVWRKPLERTRGIA